jgi:hypothetical protein
MWALLALLAQAPDSAACTGFPEPRVWLESQAWWDTAGLVLPSRVGEHIHVGTCWPTTATGGEATLDGPQRLWIRVMLHRSTGKTSILRVADGSTVKKSVTLVIPPSRDTTLWVPFDVNLTTWSTGRREVRWTVNIPNTAEGKRQYQSTGWQLCVRACSPTYRTPPWTEGRGWYEGHDYQNARFLSPLPVAPLSGVWTFKVRLLQNGPGGVFVDPNFHAGSAGQRLAGGGFSGVITLDTRTLANGVHHLVLVASDDQSAGVQVVRFRVEN